jgi:hypothetical protein
LRPRCARGTLRRIRGWVRRVPGHAGHAAHRRSVTRHFREFGLLKKYTQVTGFDEKLTDRAHCSREDDGTFDCELKTRGVGGELWGYRVHANASFGCSTATTFQKYGAHQSAIEAYQKDEFLAPSKKDARDTPGRRGLCAA